MTLSSAIIDRIASQLDACEQNAHDTPKVTDDHPGMDVLDGYAVQDALLARNRARGARVIGYKAGLTSHAKMRQMGVNEPCFGFLLDRFGVADGGEIALAGLIHPKVEPEICFVTKADLSGPGCTSAAVLAATDFILAGIEIIDSRFRDFRFDIASVIADNCSSSRFVIGSTIRALDGLDLRTLGVVLEVNGRIMALGAGAAVLGNPAAAVAMLVNHLGSRGRFLPAGSLILSGGVTEAIQVKSGDSVRLRVQELGSVGCRFN